MNKYNELTVFSWNILTGGYCTPKVYSTVDPAYLKNDYRNPKIVSCIRAQIQKGAIISLQEVDIEFYNTLVVLLSNNKYQHIYNSYGNRHNLYMGVLLAWPEEKYQLIKSSQLNPGKKISDNKYQMDKNNKVITDNKIWSYFSLVGSLYKWIGNASLVNYILPQRIKNYLFPEDVPDMWNLSSWRPNWMIMVQLRNKSIGNYPLCRDFVVATYHMPCLYWAEPAMYLHVKTIFGEVSKFAYDKDNKSYLSTIYMGDFNLKANSDLYKMINNNLKLEDKSNLKVQIKSNPKTKSILNYNYPYNDKYESAYMAKNNKEPEFTVMTQSYNKPVFKDTIDYIWINTGVKVIEVNNLTDDTGTMPNSDYPSDHLPIGALLEINI